MWNVINTIMSGGFLKGYKTYLAGAGLIVVAITKYLAGDETLTQFATGGDLLTLLGGLGLVGIRNALAAHMDILNGVMQAITAAVASQSKPAVTPPTAPKA